MGALTWECFLSAAKKFIDTSNQLNDGWVIKTMKDPPEPSEAYLYKKEHKRGINEDTFVWEYHLVYSLSYGVPVLYFKVTLEDGKKINLDTLRTMITTSIDKETPIISETEHPLLRKPFYFLHPCNTESILESLTDNGNPLVSWLSVVAAHVKLELNLEYAIS